jgi:hypothetical protein
MSMTIPSPTVSVIMAAYNGAALINETIQSLVEQSFDDFELIVVDDRSTDDTLAAIARCTDPRIRMLVSEVNQGPVRARNRAFATARGRYVAALDQDDICHPDRLARQVAYLDAHPDVVLVATAASQLRGGEIFPGRRPTVTTPALLDWLLLLQNPLIWSSVMFRAEAMAALDPVTRPDYLYAEDFDFYHRIRALGRIARIDDELTIYRRHEGGASQRHEAIMTASAGRVLTEAYRPIFGEGAAASADLVARLILDGQPPVSDHELAALGHVVARLKAYGRGRSGIDRASADFIAHEASKLWWLSAGRGVRAGLMSIGAALAARPSGIASDGLSPAALLQSAIVGKGRSLLRRAAA